MHAYGWIGILPWKNGPGMSSFCCVLVVSSPDGLVKAHFQCISVLYCLLLCCGSVECCGGPVKKLILKQKRKSSFSFEDRLFRFRHCWYHFSWSAKT